MRTEFLCAAVLCTATSTWADDVFNDDVIVSSALLCVGSSCTDGEAVIPFREGLKINSVAGAILFDDSSTSPINRDWQISANSVGAEDGFLFSDVSAGTDPFKIMGDARDNTLVVGAGSDLSSNVRVGIGTTLPQVNLHIAQDLFPRIRLEDTQGGAPYGWDLIGNRTNFSIRDHGASTIPFTILNGAPVNAFFMDGDGNVGLGTGTPDGVLHTEGSGVQLVYFESRTDDAVQVRFRTDSENRRFLAVDGDNNVKSQIIFKDNEILFTGQTDSGANRWLTIGPSGIVSQGPTCSSPCDLVFDPEHFTVPSIAERAAQMWKDQHLPAIGPTSPDAPMNLTEKTGGIIHELELAHIYIAQLHAHMTAQEDRIARQEELNRALFLRLDAMEAAE